MDLFHDGHHVRLRNLVQRTYLHAADDGVGVTLREPRASMNAAWAVHIYHGDEGPYLLLHSAAYGRYLAAAARPARLGHIGLRAELSDYDLPEVEAIMWRAVGSGFEDDVVLPPRQWQVPPLELLRRQRRRRRQPHDVLGRRAHPLQRGGHACHSWSASDSPKMPLRHILFVRALEEVDGWRLFLFKGRSVFRLRDDLAFRVAAGVDDPNIAMCVRAGRYGRLTPLVVPHGGYGDGEILEIVVFLAGTPGYDALRYPDVDA
ncbi:hypothetical protein CFC21_015159 [Triticum aestivum]|uniref:DUF569 domain-containing protein n=2 Tax=Triticum aestivum TaxID=4565 RepID=A0A9R1DVW2_WHEAT|nr:uncharacterized protein LOC123184581 [Triticum aestivum]KAF6999088.1 hypothetical protein CFC21_015159 [Triticum aestivum]